MTAFPEWSVGAHDGSDWIEREFHLPDFRAALDFAERIGAMAEEQQHHPMLRLVWGRVLVSWRTFQIRGFHRNDFIMAAKTDALWTALD